jgi:glycosyltransferase involved in cell wall biosynthesis
MADNPGGPARTRDLPAQIRGRPARVAQVNDIAAVASALARAMDRLGADSTVIEPRRVGVSWRYPWKAASLPFRAAGIVGAGMAVRRGHFDVVHVHFARLGMIGPLGGRPYTLHIHGTDIRGVRPDSFWGRETAPFVRRARLVYYSTPDLREWVERFRQDAILLPNPIETDRFVPDTPERRAPAKRDLLVGVRLTEVKGLATILEILWRLMAARPATTVTIIDQGDGVAAAAAAVGAGGAVVPRQSRTDLAGLMAGHRLALGQFKLGIISNYELEALACGTPVVTRFDYPETYADAPPIAATADADTAAAAIVRLLDDEPARLGLADRGPAWVEANHSALTVARRVLADYRRTGQLAE